MVSVDMHSCPVAFIVTGALGLRGRGTTVIVDDDNRLLACGEDERRIVVGSSGCGEVDKASHGVGQGYGRWLAGNW